MDRTTGRRKSGASSNSASRGMISKPFDELFLAEKRRREARLLRINMIARAIILHLLVLVSGLASVEFLSGRSAVSWERCWLVELERALKFDDFPGGASDWCIAWVLRRSLVRFL